MQHTKEYYREWRRKNIIKRRIYDSNWKKQMRKTKSGFLYNSKVSSNYQHKRRLEILKLLGNECTKCGFSDWRALQVDHIEGGGSEDIRRNSWNYRYKKIIENPAKYQILCANCNFIKRHENKEFRKGIFSQNDGQD